MGKRPADATCSGNSSGAARPEVTVVLKVMLTAAICENE